MHSPQQHREIADDEDIENITNKYLQHQVGGTHAQTKHAAAVPQKNPNKLTLKSSQTVVQARIQSDFVEKHDGGVQPYANPKILAENYGLSSPVHTKPKKVGDSADTAVKHKPVSPKQQLEMVFTDLQRVEREHLDPLRSQVDQAVEMLAFQRLSSSLVDLDRIFRRRKGYYGSLLFASVRSQPTIENELACEFAHKLSTGIRAVQAGRWRRLLNYFSHLKSHAECTLPRERIVGLRSQTNSEQKPGPVNSSGKKNELVFKSVLPLESSQKKSLDYSSPQPSKQKKGLGESPRGGGLYPGVTTYGPISQARLDSLRKEQLTLAREDSEAETTILGLRNDIDKLRQQIVAMNSGSSGSPGKSLPQSGDGSLELLLLDKKINEVSTKNQALKQDLSVVEQDTSTLIKQVTDLVARSESSLQILKSTSTLGMLQSADVLARPPNSYPALNSDR